jgi:hypothetical protein
MGCSSLPSNPREHVTISVSWLPQREQTSRSRQSGTGVSEPQRRAISAGSALVLPSAARSDAAVGLAMASRAAFSTFCSEDVESAI